MQLEVKIDQEAVQQQIVQAIMTSSIGAEIQKAITKVLEPQNQGWGRDKTTIVEDAVNQAVRNQMAQLANEIVAAKREEIRAKLMEKLTDDVLDKMTSAAWAVMEGRLKSAD